MCTAVYKVYLQDIGHFQCQVCTTEYIMYLVEHFQSHVDTGEYKVINHIFMLVIHFVAAYTQVLLHASTFFSKNIYPHFQCDICLFSCFLGIAMGMPALLQCDLPIPLCSYTHLSAACTKCDQPPNTYGSPMPMYMYFSIFFSYGCV